MGQKEQPDSIPKKKRPYDKSHGFHANQEGLRDIQHDDVSSPPVERPEKNAGPKAPRKGSESPRH